MKKNLLLLALAGIAVLGNLNAYAGNRAGAVTITPGAGYYFFSDKRHLDDTGIGDIALAYDFTDNIALEGMVGFFNTDFSSPPEVKTHGRLYLIDGIYRFTPYGLFEPYVSAGLGVLHFNRSGLDANNQANLNAAIGTQFFADDSIALRAEVRDLYTMSGGKNDVMINFGISFLLGGQNPPATASPYKDQPIKNIQ